MGKNRFSPDQSRALKLLESFLQYIGRGERESLLSLLHEDIVLWSDGGGKAPSAINPIYGSDKVLRFFLGIAKKNSNPQIELLQLNGGPALVTHDGQWRRVLLLDIDGGEISQCYIVANPEKLTHL